MAAHRLSLFSSVLLSWVCIGCDDPLEPAPPTAFAAAAGVKVNAPSSPQAVAASYAQIDFSWQDNSSNETGFEVHRSTTGATGPFSLLGATGSGQVAYSDGGLTPSTAYCYQARAFRTTGNKKTYSGFTSAACATTQAPPLPAAPSGAKATSLFSGYRVRLTWTDNSANEAGFRVERSGTSQGPWTSPGSVGANTTSFETSQTPDGEKPTCYRVLALNSFGDSGPSNVDCVMVPATPTNLVATVVADGIVELTWTDNATLEDGYEVQRAGGGGSEGISVIKTLPANAASYRDEGLSDGAYGYWVRATKDGGTSANSNLAQILVATTAPNAPVNVDVMPQGSAVVTIRWVDEATNEEGTRIERSTNGGTTWASAGTVDAYQYSSEFWDGAAPEQEVCYRVITFNRVGESPPSNTDCTTPPAAPSDFAATLAGSDAVDFTWTDNSGAEDGHHILLDYGYGYWEAIAVVGANVTSVRYENFPGAQYYTFYVVATKDGGYSDWSNPASPTSPAP
jgi:hypothetical protein